MKLSNCIIIGLMIFTATTANAQGAADGDFFKSKEWRANKEEMIKKMYDQLDLTTEQNRQLQQHRDRHRSNREAFHKQIKKKQADLSRELQKPAQNTEAINQLHNEIKMLKMKRADHRLNSIQEVRRILTPEQFKKFMELKSRMGKRR